jgi:hypothetical protein
MAHFFNTECLKCISFEYIASAAYVSAVKDLLLGYCQSNRTHWSGLYIPLFYGVVTPFEYNASKRDTRPSHCSHLTKEIDIYPKW